MNSLSEAVKTSKTSEGRCSILKALDKCYDDNSNNVLEQSRSLWDTVILENNRNNDSFFESLNLVLQLYRNLTVERSKEFLNFILPDFLDMLTGLIQDIIGGHVGVIDRQRNEDQIQEISTTQKKFIIFSAQFISNLINAYEDHVADFILQERTQLLAHILASAVISKEKRALIAAWSSLHAVVNPIRFGSLPRIALLIQQRGLLCQFFLSISDSSSFMNNKQSSASNSSDSDGQEWILFIILAVARAGKLQDLFQSIGNQNSGEEARKFNFEQVIFLHGLYSLLQQEALYEEHFESEIALSLSEFIEAQAKTIILYFTSTIRRDDQGDEELQLLYPLDGNEDQGIEARLQQIDTQVHRTLLCQYLLAAIDVTDGYISISLHGESSAQRRVELDQRTDLLQGVINYIARYRKSKYFSSRTKSSNSSNDRANTEREKFNRTEEEEYYAQLYISCLQLVSNLIYRNETLKLKLLNGGINVILSSCATDVYHPLAREWAILTVRNACEDCPAVQKYISDLQPQDVLVVDEHALSPEWIEKVAEMKEKILQKHESRLQSGSADISDVK